MTAYRLWCPASDGTQHRNCMTDEQAERFPWGRRLPRRDEIEAYLLRDRSADHENVNELRLRWHRNSHIPFSPEPCHFDFVGDPALNEGIWPRHYQNNGRQNIGPWGWGREQYRNLTANYRCSVHGTQPQPYMRDHAFLVKWNPIRRGLFTEVARQVEEDELRSILGRYYDEMMRLGVPYGMRFLRYTYPNHTVDTSHDLW